MARLKTHHLAALAIASAGLIGAPAQAQLQNMLLQGIQAPGAGINIGTQSMTRGTIQYTNSAGASDSFSVGTNTNISSNASASSTSDYSVSSDANFAMGNNGVNCGGSCGGLTTINQTIGTSGASNSSRSSDVDRELSASRSAEYSAETEVNKSYKTEHNGTSGWWYWRNNKWNSTTESDYNAKRSASYEAAYDASYSAAYSSLAESSTQDGTISGTFVKDAGATTSKVSDTYSFKDASGAAVAGSVTFGADGGATFAAATAGEESNVVTSELTRETSFVQDKESTNDVTVKGIGANNNVVAADTANFTTQINRTSDASVATVTGAGTASGSASGGVSTTSSANSSSSTFVNSFVTAY